MSNESAADPEEAFVASISSCHMLWFLSIAVEKNYIVERYEDHAEGILGKNADGRLSMTKVTLKPKVLFSSGTLPSPDQVADLHHLAHEKCFIANSVKTEISIEQA
jgi:organic hydroperoxide reductase OsmC/OhrA